MSMSKMLNYDDIKHSETWIDCYDCYEHSDFKNIQPIGRGSFGSVVRANKKNTDCFFALKSFNHDKVTLKEVLKEVQFLILLYLKKGSK